MIEDKKIKIVVFYRAELTQRAIDDMALDELAQWFDLEFWDCRAVHWPSNPPVSHDRLRSRPFARVISGMRDLKKQLERLPKNTIGFMYMLANPQTYKVHKLIASKIACAVLYYINVNDSEAGKIINHNVQESTVNAKHNRNKFRDIFTRMKHILYRVDSIYLMSMYIKYHGDERFLVKKVYLYNKKVANLYKKVCVMGVAPTANYQTCHPDYDKILKLGTAVKYKEPYMVYIDESYMDSLDAKERFPNIDLDSMRQSYYESMNRFFDMVEAEYNCKVVIALHPNAFRKEYPFNGRECIQYKTVELVKDSKGVILHASNAINFIAYYDKPICYVYNNVLNSMNYEGSLYALGKFQCEQLGLPFLHVEELSTAKGVFKKLDSNVRNAVINKYFGNISRGVPNSVILKEHFEAMYKEITNQKNF